MWVKGCCRRLGCGSFCIAGKGGRRKKKVDDRGHQDKRDPEPFPSRHNDTRTKGKYSHLRSIVELDNRECQKERDPSQVPPKRCTKKTKPSTRVTLAGREGGTARDVGGGGGGPFL